MGVKVNDRGVGFRLKFLIAALLLLAATAGFCAGPLPVVRLAYAPHDHHAPLYVAAMNAGYFKDNGGLYLREVTPRLEYSLVEDGRDIATVTIDSSTGGSEIVRKLSEDQFDMAFGGFPAMVSAIDRGSSIKVIAPVMSGGTGLLLNEKAKAKNWTEFIEYLKNPGNPQLRIGHQSKDSVQSLALKGALQREGITATENQNDHQSRVLLVDLHGTKNLLPAMEGLAVDGIVAMQPYIAISEKGKAGHLVAYIEDFRDEAGAGIYPCCALAARGGFIKGNTELARKLLLLLLRANRFITQNPAEAANYVAKWLNLPQDVEASSLPTISFTVDYDESWERGVDRWLEAMVKSGNIKGLVKEALSRGNSEARALIYDQTLHDWVHKKI